MDPAHERGFQTRENLDATFEWNKRTIFQCALVCASLLGLYFFFRDMVDRAN